MGILNVEKICKFYGGVDKHTSRNVVLDVKNIYEMNDEEQSKLRRKKIALIYSLKCSEVLL